jgi:hypothetical protein
VGSRPGPFSPASALAGKEAAGPKLQASTSLVDGVSYTSLVAGPSGLIECLEDMQTNAPARFYRLKWP